MPFESDDMNIITWVLVTSIKLLTVAIFILQEIEIIYYIAYGVLAFVGTVVHPFFFAFHLTEIMIRYPTLKNIVKSVYMPRKQLGLAFVLYLILNYIYSLIAYEWLQKDYQGNCVTTLYCMLFTFDWTFKANAGVGGYLTGIEDESTKKNFKIGRFIFDNTFNIILAIIMINIVAGIIIDTFGSLREEENTKNKDIEDKCFICGNLKTDFDRNSELGPYAGGFKHHIKFNHYMWNYLYFLAYLKYKDPNEFTGIESYI